MKTKSVVYVGKFGNAQARDINFQYGVPMALPENLANKILRAKDFITQEEYEAQNTPPAPPAEEPVEVVPEKSPARASTNKTAKRRR